MPGIEKAVWLLTATRLSLCTRYSDVDSLRLGIQQGKDNFIYDVGVHPCRVSLFLKRISASRITPYSSQLRYKVQVFRFMCHPSLHGQHNRLRSVYQFCGGICPAKKDKVHSAWSNRFKPCQSHYFRKGGAQYSFSMQRRSAPSGHMSSPKINPSVNSFGVKNGI